MWWKVLLFIWIAFFSAVGIMTPIAGTVQDLAIVHQMSNEKEIPVRFSPGEKTGSTDGTGAWYVQGTDGHGAEATYVFAGGRPAELATANMLVVQARYDSENHQILVSRVLSADPLLTFPFIPGLEERAKIIFFHVPVSWLTVIAFLVSMWFGIKYLRTKNLEDDDSSSTAATLGLLFCILATTTGSVWAKFNWGSFWNWDPRETSIFVLLLVYGAYFALRSAIDVDEKRASLSAVYSILAFVTVPFFIFIMPRIMPGLHPGSADDVNAGPVVSSGGMDGTMRVVLYSMLAGYVTLFVWIMRIQKRIHRISLKRYAAAPQA